MALGTLHEDNAVPLSEDDLRVETSRHGALYDSFSESEAGSRENSGAAGQEFFKRTSSASNSDVPVKTVPAASRRWFGLRKAASAGDLAVSGSGDASRGSSGRGGMRQTDSVHDASQTSQRSAEGRAVRFGKGNQRSHAPTTTSSTGDASHLRSASLRRLKYGARAAAERASALDDVSAPVRASEREAPGGSGAQLAPEPRGADYYRAQAAAWREAAALEAAGRPLPRHLVIPAGARCASSSVCIRNFVVAPALTAHQPTQICL